MKVTLLPQVVVIATIAILVLTTGIEAKKKNNFRRKDDPGTAPDVSGKRRDKSQRDLDPPAETPDTIPVPAPEETSPTTTATKNVPVIDPAVAPDVDVGSPPGKKGKHHHRDRKRNKHREAEAEAEVGRDGVVVKERKDKGQKKKDKERKKHHRKHGREETITTTMANDGVEVQPQDGGDNEIMAVEPTVMPAVANNDPLVEPEVDVDVDLQLEATIATTTVSSKNGRKGHRNRSGKRMRDQGQTEVEADVDGEQGRRDKVQKKKDRAEKKKQRKQNVDAGEDLELTVNPTPAPAADGVKLTPSGPSPLQTTQQQSPQPEPETKKSRKDKKKAKDAAAGETMETEDLSKTEKRIQRLERKMKRIGQRRKNATKVTCADHEDCGDGQCCLLRRSKRVCHVVAKPEGHHCVHSCMCAEGLTCLSKNGKQKSLSKGHCRRVDITDLTGDGATEENEAPGTSNELPQ